MDSAISCGVRSRVSFAAKLVRMPSVVRIEGVARRDGDRLAAQRGELKADDAGAHDEGAVALVAGRPVAQQDRGDVADAQPRHRSVRGR